MRPPKNGKRPPAKPDAVYRNEPLGKVPPSLNAAEKAIWKEIADACPGLARAHRPQLKNLCRAQVRADKIDAVFKRREAALEKNGGDAESVYMNEKGRPDPMLAELRATEDAVRKAMDSMGVKLSAANRPVPSKMTKAERELNEMRLRYFR